MITSIISTIISIIIIFITRSLFSNLNKIERNGVEVKGIITEIEPSIPETINIYYPIVKFLTLEKEWIVKRSKISIVPGIYKKGQEVIVKYQLGNPTNFFIKNKLTYLIPAILLVISLALFALGISFLIDI